MKINFIDKNGTQQAWEALGFPVQIRQNGLNILNMVSNDDSIPEPWTDKIFTARDGSQLRIVVSNAPALRRACEALAPYHGLKMLTYQTKQFHLEMEC